MRAFADMLQLFHGGLNSSPTPVTFRQVSPEADLGMFSMFGRTGAPTKRGPHRPEIVERYAMHYVLEA